MKKFFCLLSYIALPVVTFCQQALPYMAKANKDTMQASARKGLTVKSLQTDSNIQTPAANKHAGRLSFYASTALSDQANDLASSLTAAGKIQTLCNPVGNFYLGVGANLLNVNPARAKKDSVDFNSLMFPETGNFGVLITPSYRISLNIDSNANDFSLTPFYEFAYRRISIDSPDLSFKVYNHTFGIGLQWHYKPDENDDKKEIIITANPYWHLFNIPVEDVKSFTSFINDTLFEKAAVRNKIVNVNSFGFKLTLQYSNFIFFADFRRNMHTDNLADNDPFKGGAVNVGFITSFKIFSF